MKYPLSFGFRVSLFYLCSLLLAVQALAQPGLATKPLSVVSTPASADALGRGPGNVLRIHKDLGQTFASGELLIELDSGCTAWGQAGFLLSPRQRQGLDVATNCMRTRRPRGLTLKTHARIWCGPG